MPTRLSSRLIPPGANRSAFPTSRTPLRKPRLDIRRRTLRGKADRVRDYRQVASDLFPVALLFLLGQRRVWSVHLRLPPFDQVGRDQERAVVSPLTRRVQVTLPVRPKHGLRARPTCHRKREDPLPPDLRDALTLIK